MPVTCPIALSRMDTEEFAELDYHVMARAFESHRQLGRLADESVYQADLAARLESDGLNPRCEVPVQVSYRNFVKTYYLDLVVDSKVVYELKTVRGLAEEHEAQLMNYLLLLDANRGKLVNFRSKSVTSRFVNAPLTLEERRGFQIHAQRWKGGETVLDWIVEMLHDWGTALELPLYHQSIVHFLGGGEKVARLLPMQRDGIALGSQRFHLMEDGNAFRITAYGTIQEIYETQIRKLIRHSPLKSMHWINIGYHDVHFTTIS